MKLRIEIADDLPEDEVYIRCRAVTDEISRLQRVIQGAAHKVELQLYIGDTEYYVSPEKILFFETADGKVSAHTRDRMYYTDTKLYELEALLPYTFVRVSKSCILNSAHVASLSHSLTGSAEATFFNSYKKAYISRMYYKILKEKIYETRIAK